MLFSYFCFKSISKVQNFLSRFSSPPHILELEHLTVTGDVTFGSDVTLKGNSYYFLLFFFSL